MGEHSSCLDNIMGDPQLSLSERQKQTNKHKYSTLEGQKEGSLIPAIQKDKICSPWRKRAGKRYLRK